MLVALVVIGSRVRARWFHERVFRVRGERRPALYKEQQQHHADHHCGLTGLPQTSPVVQPCNLIGAMHSEDQ